MGFRPGGGEAAAAYEARTGLKAPRIIWLMIPAGKPTDDEVSALAGLLSKGDIVIDLYGDLAPLTVNSFIFLARQDWYNGVTFHTVVNITAGGVVTNYVQTGDPTDTGWGNPGYFIPDEINPDLTFDAAGWVGMANTGPDTNGSQFFITRAAMPQLNGKHTLFGKVISGLDVLARLTPRDPALDPEAPPGDIISSVTIEEK